MRITKYTVINVATQDGLDAINAALVDGWELYGYPIVGIVLSQQSMWSVGTILQAIVWRGEN